MKVVIASATEKEIEQIKQIINPSYFQENSNFQVSFHITGIGILSSSYSLTKLIYEQKPDLIIQAGIAGCFNKETTLGKVVTVKDEYLADTGVEENESFKDIFDLNLLNEDLFPFANRKLYNPDLEKLNFLKLDEVTGITINEITTRPRRIEQLKAKYKAETESMEGASLHYCCLQTATKFIQIRAISNFVGERNKAEWKFKAAFENLSDTVVRYIGHLYTSKKML